MMVLAGTTKAPLPSTPWMAMEVIKVVLPSLAVTVSFSSLTSKRKLSRMGMGFLLSSTRLMAAR